MSDSLVERLRNWTTDWDGSKMVAGEPPKDGIHCDIIDEAAARISDLEAQLAQRDAALKAADDLAHETERRINDLGGYDGRFPVRQALTAYRKARGQDAD